MYYTLGQAIQKTFCLIEKLLVDDTTRMATSYVESLSTCTSDSLLFTQRKKKKIAIG